MRAGSRTDRARESAAGRDGRQGMRILFANYEYPPLGGGGGIIMAQLAEQLAQRHEVHVLTSGSGGLPAFEVVGGCQVHRVRVLGRRERATASLLSMVSYLPASIWHGSGLVRRVRFDVLNTWFAVPTGPAGVVLARLAGCPHVLTLAGGDVYDPSKSHSPDRNAAVRRVVSAVIRRADRVAAVSSDLRTRAIEYLGAGPDLRVIPLGLVPPHVVPATRADLGLPDVPVVISVGRLVARKSLDTLLTALAQLRELAWQAVIVGDGPEGPALASLAEQLGIRDRVTFTGHVTDERKFQLLSAAEVFAMPSLHEGFCIAYLEAMYFGLPVVATTCGGQLDFLRSGRNAFLVTPRQVEELTVAMRALLADPALRSRMGACSREDVKEFMIDRMAQRYEALFAEVRTRQVTD